MSDIPTRADFEKAYSGRAPWDIPGPQPVFAEVVPHMAQRVLDLGCGTGELALHVAATGRQVLGIDYLAEPIEQARTKALERAIDCEFQVGDALQLSSLGPQFGTVLDSGLFHVFSDDDRVRYVAEIAAVLQPGGNLFLLCFSILEPGTQGPRRIAELDLRNAFAEPTWRIDSIEPVRFQVRSDLRKWTFSDGGPHAWFVVVQRGAE